MGKEFEVGLLKYLLVTVPRKKCRKVFYYIFFFHLDDEESGKCLLASPSTPSSFVFIWDVYQGLLQKG